MTEAADGYFPRYFPLVISAAKTPPFTHLRVLGLGWAQGPKYMNMRLKTLQAS